MIRLTAENAWVEFPVRLSRSARQETEETGATIDAGRGVVMALQDISLDLREGDRIGLVGHNGAGKTTMLRLLAGAYTPTRGRVTVVGRVSTLFNATPGINPDGTGRENIITCGLYLGMSRRQIIARIDEIIDFAELGPYIDLPVRIYSAGMTTRLGFSIATAVDPEILLLDEGLATGDAQFAQKAQTKMQELMHRSAILVIATHSQALVERICNRCLLMEHGRIVADGAPASLVASYHESVIAKARAGDKENLRRAYEMATDMAKRGERPSLTLEEQGLRYALSLYPDDQPMLRRYAQVLRTQGAPVPAHVEIPIILDTLKSKPGDELLRRRLQETLETGSEADLPPGMREAAQAALSGKNLHP